jgi:N-formylglutamate deformylase
MLVSSFTFGDESLPLLATAIHNGHHLPPELEKICGIPEQERLREEDPYTGEFAGLFPNHVVVKTSRFAIDLNRPPHRAIYQKPEDCWGLPARTQAIPEEVLARLNQDYQGWHKLMEYQMDTLLKRHEFLVVLDLHSYNHRRGGPQAEPDPQENNPDIIIGRSNLREEHYPASAALRHILGSQTYLGKPLDCREDVKFPGGNFPRWLNAKYSDRLICLAIEFKKTFMDEWSGELDEPAFRKLKKLFLTSVGIWLKRLYGIELQACPFFARSGP